jgi:hypothetical protein
MFKKITVAYNESPEAGVRWPAQFIWPEHSVRNYGHSRSLMLPAPEHAVCLLREVLQYSKSNAAPLLKTQGRGYRPGSWSTL